MNQLREAALLALMALSDAVTPFEKDKRLALSAIDALREALAGPDAQPARAPESSTRDAALDNALRTIGDYAHDHSTGPAVQDALWEIRSMAYDAINSEAAPQPAIAPEPVALTDAEIEAIRNSTPPEGVHDLHGESIAFARAIEAAIHAKQAGSRT